MVSKSVKKSLQKRLATLEYGSGTGLIDNPTRSIALVVVASRGPTGPAFTAHDVDMISLFKLISALKDETYPNHGGSKSSNPNIQR